MHYILELYTTNTDFSLSIYQIIRTLGGVNYRLYWTATFFQTSLNFADMNCQLVETSFLQSTLSTPLGTSNLQN